MGYFGSLNDLEMFFLTQRVHIYYDFGMRFPKPK